ncbi:hypothetical protein NQ317_018382 [Molorchus minor]|uniref:Thioredoxin-like fold domain-containing protein n=1 Tax=Molorchus minor TaxID=1323400 RepID=A0ABQ9JFL6_9CUCU|nr:hypothetical protein NQ317_018382 [Molorchus minor]
MVTLKLLKEISQELQLTPDKISADSYSAYIDSMPWLTVPFQQTAVRAELAQLYGIRGIPTLLLLDNNGHIITMDARTELAEDPLAQNFPWKPRPVNILTERYLTKLHDYPAIVLFVADNVGVKIPKFGRVRTWVRMYGAYRVAYFISSDNFIEYLYLLNIPDQFEVS